jgi:ABC-type lipoprotein export system ATPase subunit
MEISDFSILDSIFRNHHHLLPKNIRALIVGKSGSGKSTLLYNLILKPWLDYDNLMVFGKSLHQMEYQVIKAGFEAGLGKEQIANVFKNQDSLLEAGITALEAIQTYTGLKENNIKANFYTDCDLIPDPSELDPKAKNLLILDDCYLGKQNKAEAYYSRGRHNSCDVIFLSQNYFRLPRQTIRENCNLLMLFQQDIKNLQHIHADHCFDIPFEEFREFCKRVWKTKHAFVTIDLTSTIDNGRYRKNLDTFYIPNILLASDQIN